MIRLVCSYRMCLFSLVLCLVQWSDLWSITIINSRISVVVTQDLWTNRQNVSVHAYRVVTILWFEPWGRHQFNILIRSILCWKSISRMKKQGRLIKIKPPKVKTCIILSTIASTTPLAGRPWGALRVWL